MVFQGLKCANRGHSAWVRAVESFKPIQEQKQQKIPAFPKRHPSYLIHDYHTAYIRYPLRQTDIERLRSEN